MSTHNICIHKDRRKISIFFFCCKYAYQDLHYTFYMTLCKALLMNTDWSRSTRVSKLSAYFYVVGMLFFPNSFCTSLNIVTDNINKARKAVISVKLLLMSTSPAVSVE